MNIVRKIAASKYWWVALLLVLLAVNFLASAFHSRIDLTKEKRYTLSSATRNLLLNLDNTVRIDVFLKGDFTAGFRKLANSVEEFLDNCKDYSGGNLVIRFIDPFKAGNDSAASFIRSAKALIAEDSFAILRDTSGSELSQMRMYLLRVKTPEAEKEVTDFITLAVIDSISSLYNISPFVLPSQGKMGDVKTEKSILPGAVIHYKDKTMGVDLLKGSKTYGTDPEQLAALYNNVEATLEYKFASAIQKITSDSRPMIGYALGNGEAWGYNVDDAVQTLFRNYRFDTVNVKTAPLISPAFDAVVVVKPTLPFTEEDKLKLDQYLMNGGKLFWMIDNMYTEFDSLYKSGGFVAFDRSLNLDDFLYKYGVRINNNLLQDMQSDKLPQVTGGEGNPQQQRLVDWPFFPVLNGTSHPISKNLDGVRAWFPQTLDTVPTSQVKKTFLLKSSANARVLPSPAIINFEFMQIAPDVRQFTVHDTSVAVLLEGRFTSAFKNRVSAAQLDSLKARGEAYKESSPDTKMIVVADGDIATNQYSQMNGPLPMGMNLFTRYTFANKAFFENAIDYLVNPSGILETRAKDYTLRLLDPIKVEDGKSFWQLINIVVPVILVIFAGLIYQQVRKRKYAA